MLDDLSARYKAFLFTTALLLGFGFVTPPAPLLLLGLLWSVHVIGLAMFDIARLGLVQGLAFPIGALAVATILNPTALLPMCVATGSLCIGLPVSYLVLRSAIRKAREGRASTPRRDPREELVSVVARGTRESNVNASTVLDECGFAPENDGG